MNRVLFTLVASSFLLAACAHVRDERPEYAGVVQGSLLDSTSGQPVLMASVWLEGTTLGTWSDSKGEFRITNIPSGDYTLRVTSTMYEDIDTAVEISSTNSKHEIGFSLPRKNFSGNTDSLLYDSIAGYEEGKSQATQDIAEFRVRVFHFGLLTGEYPSHLDRESGLPAVPMGCIVTGYSEGFNKGYRETIASYIDSVGPIPNSRLQWEEQILEPMKFFKKMTETRVTISGTALRDTIATPATGYSLCLAYDEWRPVIRVLSPLGERDIYTNLLDVDGATFVFGPPESYLLILKSDQDYFGRDGYCVVDYQYGGVIGW